SPAAQALALAPLSALLPLPPQYVTPVVRDLLTELPFVGYANLLASYQIPKKSATVKSSPAIMISPPPSTHIIAQGSPPRIPTDLAMEVMDQIESMNLTDASPIQDPMLAVWSVDLAKKYLHLLWALLNERAQIEALTATDVVLATPLPMRLL
uniref:Uncharacterized protein n=1 Tax=Romanomermis culicivorax TaxID=13658 RepID=A0A915I1A5_ROMCU